MESLPPIIWVVIDDTAGFGRYFRGIAKLTENGLSGRSGSDDHDVVFCPYTLLSACPFHADIAVGKADSRCQSELACGTYDIIGNGHPFKNHRNTENLDHRCGHCRCQDPVQFVEAGEAPKAVV